ncbi:fibroblast growth factor receptor-like [Ptychodera flava]|uniref:fibroblast growth factor receptor-like n=1 Tax=Ptychodera flava TaxID=63121 RepID=UPI00396AA9AA
MTDDRLFLVRLTQDDTHCAKNSSIAVYSEDLKNMCQQWFSPFEMKTSDIRTANNHTVIEALQYGITYTVMVAVLDLRTNETSASACKTDKSPDCYGVTRSREHCQPRCIATSGPPVNLTVASIRRDFDNENAAEVTVSWLRPVQHNDNVQDYYIELVNTLSRFNTHFTDVKENASYSDITPFIAKFTNVEVNVTYAVTVYVYGNFRGQGYERGESATLELMMVPEDIETPSTTREDFLGDVTTGVYSTQYTSGRQSRIPLTAVVVPVVGCSLLVFLILFIVIYRALKRRRQQKEAGVFVPEFDDDEYVTSDVKEERELRYTTGQSLIAKHEFPRHRLALKEELGRGHFGVVYKAIASGLAGRKDALPVAVKMLKNNATLYQKEDMIREITILQEIGQHPNILGILGCCTIDDPYFLITEYMQYGDLLHFLWRSRKKEYQNEDSMYELSEKSFYQIARQIARGMVFLSENKYVHGDLAARNVLVGEDLLIKITDFGLANDVYLQGWTALPKERLRAVKWVSIETNLQGMCTIESDIWSFGIVLYEIVTQGDTPYPGMSAAETIAALKDGYRMEITDDCPEEMYHLMCQCWQENPSDRPPFADLLEAIDLNLVKYVDYMGDGPTATDNKYENDGIIEMTRLSSLRDNEIQLTKKSVGKTQSQGSGDSAFTEESAFTGESNISSSSSRTSEYINERH